MPSVVENRTRWTEHTWAREGHEWSPGQTAAGGEMLWWRSLLPRIAAHIPVSRILEIGPGFGRWTGHLLDSCDQLTAVDVTPRCIEHCRDRFAASGRFQGVVNDGESLAMIPDGSLDFVFSFDSLVHVEAPIIRAYMEQISRKLRPGGAGFIHHSNLQSFAGSDGSLPPWLARRNWRAETMSAKLFRDYCEDTGLVCTTQEVINWISRSQRADRHRLPGSGLPLTDVLSTFVKPANGAGDSGVPTRVYLNPRFAEEWRQLVVLASLYGRGEEAPAAMPASAGDRAQRAARLLRHEGLSGLASRVRARVGRDYDHVRSLMRERRLAARVRRHEPIGNAVRRRVCPDCGGALCRLRRCRSCHAEFRY